MLSTPSLVYGFCLVFFLGRCDSKALLPALQYASSSFKNYSFPELGIFDQEGIDVDVQEPDTWNGYVADGARLYKEWDAEDDEFAAETYQALTEFFEQQTPWPGSLTPAQTEVFEKSLLPADTAEWSGYIFQPPEFDSAEGSRMAGCFAEVWLRCQINPLPPNFDPGWPGEAPKIQPGAILIQDWYRDISEPDSFESNADVLWSMWLDDARRKQGQVRGIFSVSYDPVTDGDTVELLEYALSKFAKDPKESVTFKFPGAPKDPSENDVSAEADAFYAILGSPSGRNVMSLLMQQKGPLVKKYVKEIIVFYGPGHVAVFDDDRRQPGYALIFKLETLKPSIDKRERR